LLGKNLKGDEVIELRSDLGGGKTTFVRGLAKGIGSKNNVTSPTFTLNRVYNSKNLSIHHFDFYRLNDAGIMSDQLAESIGYQNIITIIEWPNVVFDVLPENRFSIELKPVAGNPDERVIIIGYTRKLRPAVARAETEWQEIRP